MTSVTQIKDIARQLKIQTGVCKRLSKDVTSYQKEAEEAKAAIDKLAETCDETDETVVYRLKQSREALAETMAMIEDSRNRLDEALPRLESLLKTAKEKLAESIPDDISAAESVVSDARNILATSS